MEDVVHVLVAMGGSVALLKLNMMQYADHEWTRGNVVYRGEDRCSCCGCQVRTRGLFRRSINQLVRTAIDALASMRQGVQERLQLCLTLNGLLAQRLDSSLSLANRC